jgi:hypothetical protein
VRLGCFTLSSCSSKQFQTGADASPRRNRASIGEALSTSSRNILLYGISVGEA